MRKDDNYTLREKFGSSEYEIQLIGSGWNDLIYYWTAKCRVSNEKKIARLREQGKEIKRGYLDRDSRKWKEVV